MQHPFKWLLRGPEEVRRPAKTRSAARAVRCKYCGAAAVLELLGADYKLPRGWRMIWEGLRPAFVCPTCNNQRMARIMAILKGEKA